MSLTTRIRFAIGCLRNAAVELENNLSDADRSYLMDAIQRLETIDARTRKADIASQERIRRRLVHPKYSR